MACQRCNSNRVVSVMSHASDRHVVSLGDREIIDYLPNDLGIGGGDDAEFDYCLDCGQIQGQFPLPPTCLETDPEE